MEFSDVVLANFPLRGSRGVNYLFGAGLSDCARLPGGPEVALILFSGFFFSDGG